MRFLHTSDWHIGRIFYERSLIEDQAYVLQQIVDIAAQEKVDAVLIAGDIYDRAVPPTEGVELLDWALSELVLRVGVPVLMISGNHDSGERLSFGARLLNSQRLRIVGSLSTMASPLVLEDAHGRVRIYGIPYADPAEVRVTSGRTEIQGHQEALKWCVEEVARTFDATTTAVAVAHAYVLGGTGSDSERPLSIGGKPFVEAETFRPFAYTALGHLHQRQSPSETVHYCGSPLSYHFSERDFSKSVTIVEMDADRVPKLRTIPLVPKRKLLLLSGDFDEILAQAKMAPNAEDYILVRRHYDRPRPEALAQLRTYYPRLLALEILPREFTPGESALASSGLRHSREKSVFELFCEFYRDVTDQPMNEPQMSCVKKLVAEESR